MHVLVRCKHERRCSRARGEDAPFTDVKIKLQIGNGPGGVNDVMHQKRGPRIFGISRKVSELSFSVRRRRLTFGARRGLATGAARGGRGGGEMEKSA